MKSTRDNSIELYRVMLMFGIVLLHAAGVGDVKAQWLANSLKFCVTGFVFISGYFGIRFSWQKIAKLYGLAILYAILGSTVSFLCTGNVHFISVGLKYLHGLWFLHAYAILMMFAPVLNCVFDQIENRKRLLPIILPLVALVFGWSYCYDVGHLKPYVFPAEGLGAHSPLTLIGIYVLARWFKIMGVEQYLTNKRLLLAVIAAFPFSVVGLAPYNSPFAFVLAASFFVLVRRFVRCGNWPVLLSPSMFCVYLIHVTPPGIDFIIWAKHYAFRHDLSLVGACFVVAIALFLISIAVDLCRRVLAQACVRREESARRCHEA